jgi:HEPN domain-containing protein
MNRSDFQTISNRRTLEAKALLNAGQYAGAYYLMGYSIECALKACVAKQIKRYDFPDKGLANNAFTHDLEKLIRLTGLGQKFEKERKANPALESNWAVVKDWSKASRYDLTITEAQARDLFSACTARRNGVLPWIKKRW